jgi:hypothetical protein
MYKLPGQVNNADDEERRRRKKAGKNKQQTFNGQNAKVRKV